MSAGSLTFTVAEGVATITLNRPETLNAFNEQMIAETIAAFEECRQDPAIRSIILTGEGRAFSAGQDLKEMHGHGPELKVGDHLRRGYNRLITTMVALEKPIVGAINGVAAGAGCSVALATDIRIASDRASFVQAFSRIGLVPDGGSTWLLPRLIGAARAFQMAATGETIDAETALAWGLVNDVVPAAQLPEIAAAWALRLAAGPTAALGLTKRAMWQGWSLSLAEALEVEAQFQDIAFRSHDGAEGVRAFLEKRRPEFKGE